MNTTNTICEGCLSIGRKLTNVDEEVCKIFFKFLGTSYSNTFLLLCWECRALLQKFLKFKEQIRQAHDYLVTHLLTSKQSKLTSLSNLTITECNNIQDVIYEVKITEEACAPLTFVKIEDDIYSGLTSERKDITDELFDNDDGIVSNDFDDSGCEEKEVMVDIKPNVVIENPKLKSQNSTKRNRTKENFNESDDEPLKVSNKEDKTKPRARRKRKEDIKTESRQKGSKREKPAGVVQNARVVKKLQQLNVDSDQLEMVVLSWEEVEEERQKTLASDTFTRHDYRCYDCAVGFNHRSKLEDHNMKKHDPSSGSVECSICRVRCRDSHALAAHRRRHRVRWRCRQCGSAWSRAGVAADHAARAHGARVPTHTCSVCGHQETSLGKLRNHIKNHAERQKCELCGKTFRDRTSLRTHLFIHKGEKEYSCPRCDKKFLFKKAMEIHLVTHDAPAHLYCHQCDMNFKNRMSYNQHIKYNLKHIDPAKLKYACSLCDKKFVRAIRLEEHNLAVHLKMTPITCTVPGCNFACSSRPVLRTHIRMLHRNARARRDHVCDVCGKAYTTKKSLEGHLRTHSGERPFRCGVCAAAFGYEAALYNHNKLVHLKSKCGRGRNTAPVEWTITVPAPPPPSELT